MKRVFGRGSTRIDADFVATRRRICVNPRKSVSLSFLSDNLLDHRRAPAIDIDRRAGNIAGAF